MAISAMKKRTKAMVMCLRCFMVLVVCLLLNRLEGLIGFNSKMVRLKDNIYSILTALNRSFNSKMVRLKVSYFTVQAQLQGGFNSKMVRLKGRKAIGNRCRPCSFNSKMVRLKAAGKAQYRQYYLVSIPKWYD